MVLPDDSILPYDYLVVAPELGDTSRPVQLVTMTSSNRNPNPNTLTLTLTP